MKTTRRKFLEGALGAAAFNIVPAGVLRGATAPSNQLTRALIGFGIIAKSDNHLLFKGSRLVGLCDPDKLRVEEGLKAAADAGWGRIRAYENFIRLIEDPGVDVVHICTPPHWHGVMSVMAARAGKDVWCEKPMTRTVGEGRRVMEYVKAKRVMFRLNTWFRYKDPFYGFGKEVKYVRKVVESGVLGKGPIRCVFGRGQGFQWKFHHSGRVNLPVETPPKTFDWDMWLGPAPWKPYSRHRTHKTFRGYWDYDGGGIGDMSQHYLDPLQYLLCKDETSPVKIDYLGPKQHPEAVGRFDRITYTYADGTVIILDGDQSLEKEPFITGSNGTTVWPVRLPDGTVDTWTNPGENADKMFGMRDGSGKELDAMRIVNDLPDPAPQVTDFMQCVRDRRSGLYAPERRFCLNEDTGFRSCTLANLAITAERLGRGFAFDPVKLRAVDDPAADRFLYQSMREPWLDEFMKA